MACQSLLCGAADQFNMAKALLEAGADPLAKDKVRGVHGHTVASATLSLLLRQGQCITC
jgi:hypothetical protein